MPEPADQTPEAAPLKTKRRRNWLSFSLRSLMILLTLSCVALGVKLKYDWYQKKWLVEKWVAPLANEARGITVSNDPRLGMKAPPITTAPARVKAEDEVDLLTFGILELDTSEERFSALKILVESRKEASLPALRELIPRSRHPEMQAMLLHMVSLDRVPEDIPRFEPLLQSPHAEVRGAAAEAISYIHQPSYHFGEIVWQGPQAELNTNPPVDVSFLVSSLMRVDDDANLPEQERQKKIPAGIRSRLESLMLQGESEEERTAAARALVAWPPTPYQLRLAEWGVWIDGPGKLEVSKSVLEEIPPFVHRTGNPNGSLTRNRFDGVIIVSKPIIHLTSDRPLAVDLEVALMSGRPWYAYPRPDGFTVHLDGLINSTPEMSAGELEAIEPRKLPILDPVSEGYPWIHPQCRSDGAIEARYGWDSGITGIGLRWQSLIVSPAHESWTELPIVPAERGYVWWKTLREVPSSWVTSQGETERFLYYDGPTLAKAPLSVRLDKGELHLRTQDLFWDRLPEKRKEIVQDLGTWPGKLSERDCLFVECGKDTVRGVRFKLFTALGGEETLKLANQAWLTGKEAERALLTILLQRGLTAEEARGLIESWREKFFQSPGQRLLTFLTPLEYERMCPLEIRPGTTEKVRVGIVLTEL